MNSLLALMQQMTGATHKPDPYNTYGGGAEPPFKRGLPADGITDDRVSDEPTPEEVDRYVRYLRGSTGMDEDMPLADMLQELANRNQGAKAANMALPQAIGASSALPQLMAGLKKIGALTPYSIQPQVRGHWGESPDVPASYDQMNRAQNFNMPPVLPENPNPRYYGGPNEAMNYPGANDATLEHIMQAISYVMNQQRQQPR